jgi:hypothetical protein
MRRCPRCDAAEQRSEAARAHRGGDRRGADGDHGRDAHAGEHDGQGERQLDQPEPLAVRHTEAGRRFRDRRVHLQDAGVGVAHDRQQRVEDEGDDRGAGADAAHEGERDQEPEQSEAGDRLQHSGHGQHRPRQALLSREQDPDGNADGHRHRRGEQHQDQVLDHQAGQLRAALGQEAQHAPAHPRAIGPVTAGRRRGSRRRSRRPASPDLLRRALLHHAPGMHHAMRSPRRNAPARRG